MPVEIYMPRLGLTMQEGTIVNWLVSEGASVTKGDGVAEIESEKIANVVEAPESGVIEKMLYAQGTTVPSGTVIAYIREAAEAEESLVSSDRTPVPGDGIPVSAGGGRTPPEDGRDSAGGGSRNAAGVNGEPEIKEVIPLTGTRKIIAGRMAESLRRSPQATITTRVDMSGLAGLKAEHAAPGVKYSYTDYMVRIIALALREHPLLNSSLRDDEILVYKPFNIGVAVAADNSLTVPVVKDAGNKDLSEIAAEIRDLTRRARDGKLAPEELSGGTFTFSNMGMFHADVMTPILNPPEAALLALGAAKKEVVVNEDDSWQIKPVAVLSLTIDHAVLDGMPAARFLETVTGIMADPKAYLL